MRILIVEDEKRISENILKILESQDYLSDIAKNLDEAKYFSEINSYDLLILDLMLPDGSGMEFCKDLRSNGFSSPILILTAKSQLEDKIEGFDAGADDYLTKPFLSEELLSRVKALIRRKTGASIPPVFKFNNITIDTNRREISKSGKIINLSPKEYSLFEYLSLSPCKAIDRLEILENVWGDQADQFSNTVDVHIRYLRKKLGDLKGEIIKTVKGKGYMLCKN